MVDKPSDDPASKYSRLKLHRQPREHLVQGHAWPEGRLTDDAPEEARLIQELGKRLRAAMGDRGLEEIERLSGVNKTSISRMLRGESWGTLPVIARLERVLGADLWGTEHR
ncbi:MAG: helix-turn-helix transcriptional regulator [Acidimicrobiaceae bacterium]|nr:helix-turn-helix transcriptional regulator [Acidimicrobiaceae bacterium]